ncbi:amidohydrolase family protein [Aeoliella sp. SH292]|uniref:amidohydrolase family protein n=1 Tax=Aeoliella sp. SH292 TaxID=3454464 RepID=UPI003F9C1CC4
MRFLVIACVATVIASPALSHETDPRTDALSADVWRKERRLVDMHMHIESKPERFERAVGIMNAAGVGLGVELGSGTVVAPEGENSGIEKNMEIAREVAPGRFLNYMILDYSGFEKDDWGDRAVAQIEKAHALGVAGVKEFKRLGLTVRDANGRLIPVDDPKLDPVWKRCGELCMPISIHVGDPKAFWEPYNESNERWEELKDHPSWWFGDPKKYPTREVILEQFLNIIAKHPETTFVGVHFANNPEDIDWVSRNFDKYPNMMGDIAARIPEIGRGDPEKLRAMFIKHQDRLLFGTDFQVWDRMILGSAGDDERPTDYDALVFFQKCFRFMETDDRDWAHMTPIQGSWTISSINLPAEVQRKVYFDNANKLLARSLPAPTLQAVRAAEPVKLDGKLDDAVWSKAPFARIEYTLEESDPRPDLSTAVRAAWDDDYLYLAYEAPFTELTMKDPVPSDERLGLWNDDVVELFVGTDLENINAYDEFEWAPSGEQLDVRLNLPEKDFPWSSGMESKALIDRENKLYRVEARIPISTFTESTPKVGTRWRAALYRNDAANDVFLAWRPTLKATAHVPERFGWLELVDEPSN